MKVVKMIQNDPILGVQYAAIDVPATITERPQPKPTRRENIAHQYNNRKNMLRDFKSNRHNKMR